MSDKKKIIKFNKDVKINVATVIVAAVILYVLIWVFISSRKDPITIYKVNKSNVSNNIILEGIALRQEEILTSGKSGYICYCIRDGEKVKNYSPVCTIDETGQTYDVINDSTNFEDLLTKEDYSEIRSSISLYKTGYNDVEFYSAYNFETNINNKVLELTNEIVLQKLNENGSTATMSTVNSPYSGLVTFYIDGFEKTTVQDINQDCFDTSDYKKNTLKTGDIVSADTPIIKVIPSENWNIVAPITSEQISAISSDDHIRFKINNSSYSAYMPYEIINGADGTYINIKMNKYMSSFASERYLSIEIEKQEDIGLKVPKSAILQKDVYQIPKNYLSAGGNQSYNTRFNLQVMKNNGEITIESVVPTIYKTDDEYCYVDPLSFDDTAVLFDINTNETLAVSLIPKVAIDGVYTTNRGTAEFKMVTIIKYVDDFALIDAQEDLKVYDNIVQNAEDVKENQIIY